jgi:hypothetical protein
LAAAAAPKHPKLIPMMPLIGALVLCSRTLSLF